MSLDITVFSKPSGNIHGVITAIVSVHSKEVRVGHCTLTSTGPECSFKIPAKMSIEEMRTVTQELEDFGTAVDREAEKVRQSVKCDAT
tara:strand:+ start:1106 stop:1369 length:264 start_codon:yes stop_codon:yes gene_type:complete